MSIQLFQNQYIQYQAICFNKRFLFLFHTLFYNELVNLLPHLVTENYLLHVAEAKNNILI